eukprot:CAMPEP_0119305324 /NCGR_PEP_ID=MMETSP1333-20130426/6349_1 /TAXON_ID=418940 /ORGANISM="Scyphosphaera apsteinii, Strain RCC1455" /LENGTH=194 /DNA_ID=CAMNT_0007308397 /DNA_START=93 /DNA_END=677 /DNA_ORIENTATION=-
MAIVPRMLTNLRGQCLCSNEQQANEALFPESYDDAEKRGMELFQQGEFERAIRMFELAQTLPGAGIDFVREKQSGMIGSANAPPNPRGLRKDRFATPQQKLIARYNIACCAAAMGDTSRAMQILSEYTQQVRQPIDAVNEMLVDEDLVTLRSPLRELRDELKNQQAKEQKTLFGLSIRNPLREIAEQVGVEWKD